MTRIPVTVALLCALIAGVYWTVWHDDRLQDEIDKRDTIERMNDATNDNLDDGAILDSLRHLSE